MMLFDKEEYSFYLNIDSVLENSYFKSLKFVRNEFFSLDQLGLERFLYKYREKYGVGAEQYVKKVYPSWKTGRIKMVRKTEERILICVPPLLSREKQFELLAIQIPAIIEQQKSILSDLDTHTSNLATAYNYAAKKIATINYKLVWFTKEVFPPEELKEFINLLKFTMLDCLKQSYQNVIKDLNSMEKYIPKTSGVVQISYDISLLSQKLRFDNFQIPNELDFKIPMTAPLFVTKFRDYYRKILLEHTIKQYKEDARGQVNSQIAIYDINTIEEKLKLLDTDQEYDTKMVIRGRGGDFYLHLLKKNMNRMQNELMMEYVKLFFGIIIALTVGSFLITKGWGMLISFGIVLFFIIFAETLQKINEIGKEVKEYDRKRREKFKEI